MIKQLTLIKIIAWLYIFSGAFMVLTQGQHLFSPGEISEALSRVGISFPLYAFETIIVSLLMVACGVGLLKLVSWSWWFAIFIETNTIVSKLNSVVALFSGAPVEFQVKQLVGVAISCLILVFLFRSAVLSAFSIKASISKEVLIYSGRSRLWSKSSGSRRKSHVIVGLSRRFATQKMDFLNMRYEFTNRSALP